MVNFPNCRSLSYMSAMSFVVMAALLVPPILLLRWAVHIPICLYFVQSKDVKIDRCSEQDDTRLNCRYRLIDSRDKLKDTHHTMGRHRLGVGARHKTEIEPRPGNWRCPLVRYPKGRPVEKCMNLRCHRDVIESTSAVGSEDDSEKQMMASFDGSKAWSLIFDL